MAWQGFTFSSGQHFVSLFGLDMVVLFTKSIVYKE